MIVYATVAIIISVTINYFVTRFLIFGHHRLILNYYDKYERKVILNHAMIESLLEDKDKEELLKMFKTYQQEIEGADEQKN